MLPSQAVFTFMHPALEKGFRAEAWWICSI